MQGCGWPQAVFAIRARPTGMRQAMAGCMLPITHAAQSGVEGQQADALVENRGRGLASEQHHELSRLLIDRRHGAVAGVARAPGHVAGDNRAVKTRAFHR